jgi:hypothetical protein
MPPATGLRIANSAEIGSKDLAQMPSAVSHFLEFTREAVWAEDYNRVARNYFCDRAFRMKDRRTPPKVITFVLSLVLAVIAVVPVYCHLGVLRGINGFVILLIAYVALAEGALIRGL